MSAIEELLNTRMPAIVDGGLATELERMGHHLDHPLWSARMMIEDPGAIRAVHRSFLDAGSDVITTASYQISYRGCASVGIGTRETEQMLRDTVRIAIEAREEAGRTDALVAASVGPFGAYLTDGSEYRGDYGVSRNELFEFHFRRFEILADTDADLLACETLPSLEEAEVLLEILGSTPGREAWFSFSCSDGRRIGDGTPIRRCAVLLRESAQVAAIGVNCTAPRFVSDLITRIHSAAPDKHVIVYPNSGETYDAERRSWKGGRNSASSMDVPPLCDHAHEWFSLGADLIGGCCRVRPGDIYNLADVFRDH